MDGRNGRTDAGTTQKKYIPLISSVDNKQSKSNGDFILKKKPSHSTVHKKSKQWNKYAITMITKGLSFETDLMPFTQNEKKYAFYQRIMK